LPIIYRLIGSSLITAIKSCLERYVKTGKTTTPDRGRGHRLPVKNMKYDLDQEVECEGSADEDQSGFKKVCLLLF
jgi:hypothetical protein